MTGPLCERAKSGIAILILSMVCFFGCTVTDTIYLRSLNIDGPIAQPPVHITDHDTNKSVRISPYLTMLNQRTISGRYNGTPPPYGEIDGNNLDWNVTPYVAGVDVDILASSSVALGFGVNEGNGLWGGIAELGLLSRAEGVDSRFEIGFQLQSMNYEAETIVKHDVTSIFSSGTTTTYGYFLDRGTTQSVRYYATFTVNSDCPGWLLNYFGQIGVSRQALTDFTPSQQVTPFFPFPLFTYIRTDTRIGSTATFLFFAPGIYYDAGPNIRWVAGVRLMGEFNVFENASPSFVIPFVQCDFRF